MSVSLPSKEVVIVDVPEVKQFSADFKYNYFVADEMVSDKSINIPSSILKRPSENFDIAYIDQIKTRVPRFITFSFGPVFVQDPTQTATDGNQREFSANKQIGNSGLLKKNYEKIIGEDEFSSQNFFAVSFSDQAIDVKLFDFVSGSLSTILSEITEDEAKAILPTPPEIPTTLIEKIAAGPKNTAAIKMTANTQVSTVSKLLPKKAAIRTSFLHESYIQPNQNGAFFYEGKDNEQLKKSYNLESLKKVSIHTQINSKFSSHIVRKALLNPTSFHGADLLQLDSIARDVQKNALARSAADISKDEYKTRIQPVEINGVITSTSTVRSSKKIIGYVIDKWEMLPDGNLASRAPIILENPFISSAIDMNVRYGAKYVYQMRSIVEFDVPAVLEDTNELALVKLLVSSRPTPRVVVDCVEVVPPPSPSDIRFRWDYESTNLNITWTFPPNSQRDIKRFQIFRRSSVDEAFQLQRVLDFDDSVIHGPDREDIPEYLISRYTQPTMLYIDSDFTKDSKFIYSICSIDAHGYTSNYSEQFIVSFDRYSNKLKIDFISRSGAPKQYPNMNLSEDTFVDMMMDSGHSKMKIYFSPEYLELVNNEGKNIPVLATNQNGSEYRINVINFDLLQQQFVDIQVEDKRSKEVDNVSQIGGLLTVSPNRFTSE